ncbi:hypothetical protein [Roseovarius nitratireducens]|uniref:hypothetical protein n=1 Tax=Roseovarius nitratireducens TaxID=2044597 RepID=UPI000CE1C1D4|nr:hypothetical protein [Roseovarius nitratireducens]
MLRVLISTRTISEISNGKKISPGLKVNVALDASRAVGRPLPLSESAALGIGGILKLTELVNLPVSTAVLENELGTHAA